MKWNSSKAGAVSKRASTRAPSRLSNISPFPCFFGYQVVHMLFVNMNRLTTVYWNRFTGSLGFEVQIVFRDVSLPFGDASVQSLLVQLERIFSADRLADDVRFDESVLYESQQQSDTEDSSRSLSLRSRSLSLFIDKLGGRLQEEKSLYLKWHNKVMVLFAPSRFSA